MDQIALGSIPQSSIPKGSRVTGDARDVLAGQITLRYQSGESIRSIAATTGRSYGFVHGVLTESDVELRGRGGATRRRAS